VARARAAGAPRHNAADADEDLPLEWTQYLALVSPTHPKNARAAQPQPTSEFYRAPVTQIQFPTVSSMAEKWLGCPASQASCERVFSSLNLIVDETHQSLSPEIVEIQSLFRVNGRKAVNLGWIK
jgi:hypothetical protein